MIALSLVAFLCAAAPAPKQEVKKPEPAPKDVKADKVSELLPFSNLFAPQEIKDHFDRLGITPFNDPSLRFELLVLKSWESRPITVPREALANDEDNFVPMAEIGPKDGANTVIEVRYLRVSDQVPLKKILDVYAEKSGYKITAEQPGEFNDRKVHDALLRMDTKEYGAMYTRFTISRAGNMVFLVASSTPVKDYDKYKKLFAIAAVSFKTVNR
jgi:hypothetical protein